MQNKIRAVIFDMDGVLLDTEKMALASWKYAFEKINILVKEEDIKKRCGLTKKDGDNYMKDLLGSKIDFEEVLEIKRGYVKEYEKTKGVQVKEKIEELLQYLENYKIKKMIATSRDTKTAKRYLALAKIDSYFDEMITGDMVEKGKPNPEVFLKAAKQLGELPQNCIVIEDSNAGIEAAYRAGITPIMIPDIQEPSKESRMWATVYQSPLEVIEWLKKQTVL